MKKINPVGNSKVNSNFRLQQTEMWGFETLMESFLNNCVFLIYYILNSRDMKTKTR